MTTIDDKVHMQLADLSMIRLVVPRNELVTFALLESTISRCSERDEIIQIIILTVD
jgi:hypothetical protein